MKRTLFLFSILMSAFVGVLKAQTITVKNSFSNIIEEGFVYTIQVLQDKRIIIGGEFKIKGASTINIARLKADGSLDSTFKAGTGFDFRVENIVVAPGNKLYVSGFFSNYNGTNVGDLVRLNEDGTIDTTFSVKVPGYNGGIATGNMVVQSDGKLLVVGNFFGCTDKACNFIMRLNTDGSRDNSFNTGSGFNNEATHVLLQSDGKIVVAGRFDSYNGTQRRRFIRLLSDGTRDPSFKPGSAFQGEVFDIKQLKDGRFIASGTFKTYSGFDRNGIVLINNNGVIDEVNIPDAPNFSPQVIVEQNDGKLLIAGSFSSVGDFDYNGLARLNSNGSVDTTFIIGSGISDDEDYFYCVYDIAMINNSDFIAAGNFDAYNNTASKSIVSLSSNLGTSLFEKRETQKIMNVFPNPTSGSFEIKIDYPVDKVIITDASGRIVKMFYEEKLLLDINSQPAGLYYLIVFSKGEVFTEKIIKN